VLLDHDRCYHALASRDARFDGHFVAVVRTTGIYCRPSCPAITPKRGNVDFVPTTAAAQQRGFRACRRCLPDAVPGSPDWNTRADLAARAMRLIADGVVEREGVPGLAGRLGYSDRHLTRVLAAELGAGPLALARAHRAHTARLLIETTPLGMADVAFAAGFASVRQFNDTVRAVYGVPPTALRAEAARRRRGGAVPAAAGTLVLRLPHRGPFDAAGLLGHLAARALQGVERGDRTGYARTLALPHGAATALLEPQDGHVRATLRLTDPRDLGPAVARLRRLLDLDADPVAVDAVLGADAGLAPRVAAVPGIRVPGAVDGFETAVRAVLGQQVSLAAGVTATARLAAALGEPLPAALAAEEGPDRLFPSAHAVAERGADVLTGPRRRTATLLALAAAVADGSLVLDAGRHPADLRAALLAQPGVGRWTAGYVALRVTGDPDELLATDLAVRRGAAALGLPAGVDCLTARAQPWRPWRSYAAAHLWRVAAAPTEEVPA